MGKPKYYVYSEPHDVWIDTKEESTCWSHNLEGAYDSFTEAKKAALLQMRTKVGNYRHDYEQAKENRAKLIRTKKSDIEG